MRTVSGFGLLVLVALHLVGCSAPAARPVATSSATAAAIIAPSPSPMPDERHGTASPLPSSSPVPGATAAHPDSSGRASQPDEPDTSPTPPTSPFDLISQETLLSYVEDLTAIQPYSGWRSSATEGEAQALEYVTGQLGALEPLQGMGLELERQSFRVFMTTELWETRLHLTVDDQSVEVPTDGLRGPRDNTAQALRFDSDRHLGDADRDPVVVEGPVLVVRSQEDVRSLPEEQVRGRIVFLDYAAIDRSLMSTQQAVDTASELLDLQPAGLVLVTTFSNRPGESHGAFVGDGSALQWVETEATPPALYVRLEDLSPARVSGWEDLARAESARLTWDADVLSPADSGNLIARIPGSDPSRAMILGAHVDSPNSPGALDDGSGSAALLEVARVLAAAGVQPPTDLYLVWFGSEELGLYGSAHFVATHQELLDRTLAMLQIDMLSHPLDGLDASLRLVTWSYGRLGDSRMLWPDYLARKAAQRGIRVEPSDVYYVYSDNSSFAGFDVPHADLIYEPATSSGTGIHYASHIHDPYDTVELAREMSDVWEQMVQVALTAVLVPPGDLSTLRVPPQPDRRIVFVASHTEALHMSPVAFTELGMAFALEGFDVDLIPYGQLVTFKDLESADLVVVLPVVDYPGPQTGSEPYDEAWTAEEIAVLVDYVDKGGLLVLTNSAHRLKYSNQGLDANEDWRDMNTLASQFGINFLEGSLSGSQARAQQGSPLMKGISTLELDLENGVVFGLAETAKGQILATAGGRPVAALVDYGKAGGQVLVLADVAILTSGGGRPRNLNLWRNLARYVQ